MQTVSLLFLSVTVLAGPGFAQALSKTPEAGKVVSLSEGLHGYIGFEHEKLPVGGGYCAGMGFYAAVWSLVDQPLANFQIGLVGVPYTSPTVGAWAKPGAKLGPFTARLIDGSEVTYSWYRFVDQLSFQQYRGSDEKKDRLQSLVEKLHANWPIDRDYMAPASRGTLVTLDPALLVTPPAGLEPGYVPIVTRQARHPSADETMHPQHEAPCGLQRIRNATQSD